MRKITALILAVIMLALPLCACGKKAPAPPVTRELDESETFHFGNYTYMKYRDGGVCITGYDGDAPTLVIPAVIDGADVIGIGAGAFSEKQTLTEVTLPAALEIIDDYAFINSLSLSKISIGSKVWSIGTSAFVGTPWLDAQTDEFVVVGDSVLLKYQGSGGAVTVPDGIRHTSDAFVMNADIVSVSLPDSLMTIGTSAFSFCEELRLVKFGGGLISIGNGAFDGCEKLAALNLPTSLISIGSYAFRDCFYISDIDFGMSLVSIGEYAFSGDLRIKSITLPATVKNIDQHAFRDCYSLSLVFYRGTAEQFEAMECSSSNYLMTEAERYFNYTGGGNAS